MNIGAVRKIVILIFAFSTGVTSLNAQITDTARSVFPIKDSLPSSKKKYKQFIFPAALTTYGVLALAIKPLKQLDQNIQEAVWVNNPHSKTKLDNYFQYTPGLTVFALTAVGVKGKNNFRDQVMLYFISHAIMGVIVNPVKEISHQRRPDGADYLSFPSGHTAVAFTGAEFLYQEYKDRSIWYGIGGYAMATSVAYMRIYNNKHWFKDVVAGAGIGIGSTRLAYVIYPTIRKWLFGKKDSKTAFFPTYQNRQIGFALLTKL
jgi:membrane-associated phospholipid phosphatase